MPNATRVAQHTPGPWEVGAPTETQHDYPRRYIGWSVTVWGSDRRDGGIANVSNRRPSLGLPRADSIIEAEANARLIAAAPGLLEALRPVVEVLDAEGIVYGNCDDEPLDVLSAARAAIAKAEGRS